MNKMMLVGWNNLRCGFGGKDYFKIRGVERNEY